MADLMLYYIGKAPLLMSF